MASKNTRLRVETAADVPPARVQAFNRFIDETAGIPGVDLYLHGTFDAGMNRHRGNDGVKGPRMCLCLGMRSAAAVTTWTFAFPDLSGKSSETRSLRYRGANDPRPDGLGRRPAVEAITGDPAHKDFRWHAYMDGAPEELMRRTAEAANGMAFFDLFDKDPMESLGPAIDSGMTREYGALAACVARARKCLSQAAADPSRAEQLGANLYNGFRKVAGGGQILAKSGKVLMDGTDPVVRSMAAAFPDHMGETLEKLSAMPGGPSPEELAMLDAVAAGRKGHDPAAEAYRSMGLASLADSLRRLGDDLAEEGYSAESTDLGAYLDDDGIRGLLYLSAYKCVQDHGGASRILASGKSDSVGVLPGASNVYYKLCLTRAESEMRELAERATLPPKGCAYPKLSAAGAGAGSPDRVTAALSYRLFRQEALGEDPDLASSMPAGRIYIGAHADGETGPVLCDYGLDGRDYKGVHLQDLMKRPEHRAMLERMPALREAADSGVGAVQAARDILSKASGQAKSLDVAALELAMYKQMRGPGGALARFEAGISGREERFLAAANGYRGEDGMQRTGDGQLRLFTQMKDAVSGYPDIARGKTGFGGVFLRDFEGARSGALDAVKSYSRTEDALLTSPAAAKDAAAFRKADTERMAAAAAYGEPSAGWGHMLEAASPAAAEHARAMRSFARAFGHPGASDEERKALAYAQNDYMVLCDVYGPRDELQLQSVMSDVSQEGKAHWYGLYRPMDAVEAKALRTCYGYGSSGANAPAAVGLELQGTDQGLAAALFPALREDPSLRPKVRDMLESASLDTLKPGAPRRYGAALDMIDRLYLAPQYTPEQVAPAVEAAEKQAAGMAALGDLLKRTYGEEGGPHDGEPAPDDRDAADG